MTAETILQVVRPLAEDQVDEAATRIADRHADPHLVDLPPLMSPGEFHRRFLAGVLGRSAYYQALRDGTIPATRIGTRWIIPTAAALAALGLDVSNAA